MTVILLIVTTILVPYQIVLGLRWKSLHEEVAAIASFVDASNVQRGAYPADLQGYQWIHPRTRRRIVYRLTPTGYAVSHWIVHRNISHWYDSATGWGYYPD